MARRIRRRARVEEKHSPALAAVFDLIVDGGEHLGQRRTRREKARPTAFLLGVHQQIGPAADQRGGGDQRLQAHPQRQQEQLPLQDVHEVSGEQCGELVRARHFVRI